MNDHKSLLKIILITKDEDYLLETWLLYYIKLVGINNIIVLDDCSTSQKVLDLYKKYNVDVRKIPTHIKTYNHIKTRSIWPEFFDEVEKTCHFYTLIDTDEFLCFFDYQNDRIDNTKLLQFVDNNKQRSAFPTTWIPNLHYGTDFHTPESVIDFNFDINQHNIIYGKVITNSNAGMVGMGHNTYYYRVLPRVSKICCPELFLLHVNNANWKYRIKAKILSAESYYRVENKKFETIEDLLRIIEFNDVKRYFELDIWEYFTNRKAYSERHSVKLPYEKPILRTDLLMNFSSDNSYKTEFVNINSVDKKQQIQKLFDITEWPSKNK